VRSVKTASYKPAFAAQKGSMSFKELETRVKLLLKKQQRQVRPSSPLVLCSAVADDGANKHV
jgi:hypothetical protein